MAFLEFPSSDLETSIPCRFERQVALYPDRLAVRAFGASLTYRELNLRANRIAHAILARLGPESLPVAVLLRQGAPLVAAILGALKAGKLYVPLEASHPAARLGATVAEAGAALIITDAAHRGLAGSLGLPEAGLLLIDQLPDETPEQNPGVPISPDAPAYIYYTSGSTGRPKGVYDSHRNVLHNILRYTNTLRISPEDRLTLLQGPAFSGAVSSCFGALLNGAALFPYDVQLQGIGAPIGAWLRAERITMYHSVPMLFRSFLKDDARFPDLRVVRLEGDAAAAVDVELFRRHFPSGTMLVNGLGTTETGIACQYFVPSGAPLPDGVVPVGFATPDMEALVLDDAGGPITGGEAGEIAIRSRFLATGYWRQPELTARAFLADPDGGDRRIYRTGDLGRRRGDGAIEYLGRRDGMAKLRGQRVEPAEVEAALLRLPGIRQAAAVIRPDRSGVPELLAYLIPNGEDRPTVRALREGMAVLLPAHMVPTHFIWTERLPYSDNGKVDRLALPPFDPDGEEPAEGSIAPRDELERRLVALWESVLDRRGIGVREDFFELGGDSIKAAALLAGLADITEKEFPPSLVIDAPSVEQMASLIRDEGPPGSPALVPIQPRGDLRPFFLVHAHSGEALRCGDLPRALGPDQPFYGLQSIGFTGERAPHPTIEAMAAHYLSEIRGVQPRGPYHLGGICFGGIVALEMAHQLRDAGEDVGLLYLLWNTPTDFPSLAEPSALRRFRRLALRERIERHWITERLRGYRDRLRERRGSAKLEYLAQLAGRILRRAGKAPPKSARELRQAEISRVNRLALARYRARPYAGRVTMVLLSEHQAAYSSDPARDFGRLALQGYDIVFLPWQDTEIYREPHVQSLAAHLRSAIGAAARG